MKVRAQIAEATREAHEALHGHALFAPLLTGRASVAGLLDVLSIFAGLHQEVEAARQKLGHWGELSLEPEVALLKKDLKGDIPRYDSFPSQDRRSVLGALYVAHGAAFGRSTMYRANPELASRSGYLTKRPDPDTWRHLLDALESEGKDPEAFSHICAGAQLAFKRFAQRADALSAAQAA